MKLEALIILYKFEFVYTSNKTVKNRIQSNSGEWKSQSRKHVLEVRLLCAILDWDEMPES